MKISKDEIALPNNLACPGCGASLAMRLALKALGRNTVLVIPACCWTIINGPVGKNYAGVPVFHTAFETTAAVASGIKASFKMQGKDSINVVGWAGDGGTFDIGLQALSGAAERNDDIIYVCYDNEAYMNTGIQRSSATPYFAQTTTTPEGKDRPKKDLMAILAAHYVPYIASVSLAYPQDFTKKFEKAKSIRGFKFIHIFVPCPPGQKFLEDKTIEVAKLAVETGVFPLYEIIDGKYVLSKKPKFTDITEYLKLQGRYKNLTQENIEFLRQSIQKKWEYLNKRFNE
ncbi:3-methyl-2-oxobutanoate dehydrogenase subunit beta [Desulfurella sp.]|uniref:3-methyl-2-oxobutanoate dehydrogenase subunit beta n=1 Tax=Desulfurella sp. TaxID=1962857 RepID=UPI0003E0AE57|nr:3-methyl-2-oxobutanoate dehydrogenase subunit beta [Desulfurella sp.]AHF96643.1 2-ketoisovalerate ferredoxin oxidoreductase subunit beta [Desulfurella acetivorans A63]PMP91210.1 MAG: 2-ketoisovalerate ferredoxin oxidoreductase [Desulfurella sp.]HEX13502.1 3-methyl-2-oxobutanoate dehydrogenase subunit beta [Desulfurella acetivorans]